MVFCAVATVECFHTEFFIALSAVYLWVIALSVEWNKKIKEMGWHAKRNWGLTFAAVAYTGAVLYVLIASLVRA